MKRKAAAAEPQLRRPPPHHGNTAARRLSCLDEFLTVYEPSLLAPASPAAATDVLVDVGLGSLPTTTVELAEVLRPRLTDLSLRVVGTELDEERLQNALKWQSEQQNLGLPPSSLQFRGAPSLARAGLQPQPRAQPGVGWLRSRRQRWLVCASSCA